MTSLLIFVVIVLIVMSLLLYAVQLLPLPGDPPLQYIKPLLMVLVVVIAALAILQRAGLAL